MQSARSNGACSRKRSALIGLALAVAAAPAAAQTQSDVEPGEILVYREVAPRNALVPGTGSPHTVDVRARPEWFGPLMTLGDEISDQDAAGIASGPSTLAGPAGATLAQIDALTGTQTITALNEGTERAGLGGLGETIGDAITGALDGAFAALPGGGRP